MKSPTLHVFPKRLGVCASTTLRVSSHPCCVLTRAQSTFSSSEYRCRDVAARKDSWNDTCILDRVTPKPDSSMWRILSTRMSPIQARRLRLVSEYVSTTDLGSSASRASSAASWYTLNDSCSLLLSVRMNADGAVMVGLVQEPQLGAHDVRRHRGHEIPVHRVQIQIVRAARPVTFLQQRRRGVDILAQGALQAIRSSAPH